MKPIIVYALMLMIIFLGTGCPSVDPALLQRRAELQSEKERLELKHKIIKEKNHHQRNGKQGLSKRMCQKGQISLQHP